MAELKRAREMLDLYIEAEKNILVGSQKYTMDDSTVERARLKEVVEEREKWERKVMELEGRGERRRYTIV